MQSKAFQALGCMNVGNLRNSLEFGNVSTGDSEVMQPLVAPVTDPLVPLGRGECSRVSPWGKAQGCLTQRPQAARTQPGRAMKAA